MIVFDNDQSLFEVSKNLVSFIEEAVKTTLAYEKFEKSCEISILITDNNGIKGLNKEFRGINRETDVLSFPLLNFPGGFEKNIDYKFDIDEINPETGEVMLGDIVISLEKAMLQSQDYGHSFEREVAFLTVHSMFHLLGYDHEEDSDRAVMRGKEEAVLDIMGQSR